MSEFKEVVPTGRLSEVLSDLEALAGESPVITVAAVHILKNELGALDDPAEHREVLFSRRFELPGSFTYQWIERLRHPGRTLRNLGAWVAGRDAAAYRDRCDRYFWHTMVPIIETELGAVAEPLMNTLSEAIINYAEHSFRRWALGRRIVAQIFRTEGELGYAILRPRGLGLRPFDPLELKQKDPETLLDRKRGWGHTLLMRRALFLSFDTTPRRRGMMIVVGPE